MSEEAEPELGTPSPSSLFSDASVVWQEQVGGVEEGASLGDEEEEEEGNVEGEEARYSGYAMLGDGDDMAAQDESGGEDEYGGYAPLGAGDDDDVDNDDAQQAAAVPGLEGLEVHAQMARIGVTLYVSEEEEQRRRAEAMAAFDARYQEEVRVAAVATNERFPAFSADHINDIKEAMRGISLPVDAPAWAQASSSSRPKKSQ